MDQLVSLLTLTAGFAYSLVSSQHQMTKYIAPMCLQHVSSFGHHSYTINSDQIKLILGLFFSCSLFFLPDILRMMDKKQELSVTNLRK